MLGRIMSGPSYQFLMRNTIISQEVSGTIRGSLRCTFNSRLKNRFATTLLRRL